MELGGKIRVGAGALAQHDVINIDMLLNGTGRTHTDDIFHTVAVKELMGLDANGRHSHAGSHHRDLNALVSSGVTVDTADVIHKDGIFQKIFRNKFGAQRITGHQNGLAEITGFCADVRGRGRKHLIASFSV